MPKHESRKRRGSSSSSHRARRRRSRSSGSGRAKRRGLCSPSSEGRKRRALRGCSSDGRRSPRCSRQEQEEGKEKDKAKEKQKAKEKGKEKETEKEKQKGKEKKKAKGGSKTEAAGAATSNGSKRKRSPGARGEAPKAEKRSKKAKVDRDPAAGAEQEEPRNAAAPAAASPEAVAVSTGSPPAAGAGEEKKAPKALLGDLAELQRGLDKERSMLQLFVLKVKQEHEEHKEPKDKRERREKEYFKAEFGDPCGPTNQLILEDELGRGVFSTVYRCRDMGVSGKEYAIKFIRANPMLRKATEKEIRLMRRLRNEVSVKDPEGARCFLGLAGPETFEHAGHLALVFHLQRCDLRSGLQKYGQGRGLPLPLVRSYCRDIFLALRALSKVKIIHSDVKPDNLLMSLDKASVRLSDFGSAMDMSERIRTDYLQPRYYRAPEVILGQSYTTQVDVWSAGATVFEIATGRFLFTGKTNNGVVHEHLKTCGAFSQRFATTGEFASKHFNSEGDFRWKAESGEQLLPASAFRKPSQPVGKLLGDVAKKTPPGVDASQHQASVRMIADLIAKAVCPDPAERATPEAILAHRFLQKSGQ